MADVGEIIACFGYGLLVNIDTLCTQIIHYEKARLKGFERHWQALPEKKNFLFIHAR